MNKRIYFILMMLVCYEIQLISVSRTTQDHSITIFVHGTYLMRKFFQYSHYRSLTYCPQGLSLAKDLPKHYHFYKMAKGCISCDNQSYDFDQFYIFGWKSEHVNDRYRNKAAKDLVNMIYYLIANYYNDHGFMPKIRLIGYSHGGNVILNMANHLPAYLDIDMEVWLFGTPIQQINHNQIYTHCFKKIYSIYSKRDWVQTIDPQGIKNRHANFWSARTFEENAPCIQVDFTVNGQAITHDYYNQLFQFFPKIKKVVEQKVNEKKESMIAVNFKI